MDIRSGAGYPAGNLSNFHPHPFVVDGVEIASMEGFLQSLKFKNTDMQREICKLVGRVAKARGVDKAWYKEQTLYWMGVPIKRESVEYQALLDKAYTALAQNESFRKALLATQNATLTHSLGQKDPKRTILTKKEFCSRLIKLREQLQKGLPPSLSSDGEKA